jgi:hypothetical protein
VAGKSSMAMSIKEKITQQNTKIRSINGKTHENPS